MAENETELILLALYHRHFFYNCMLCSSPLDSNLEFWDYVYTFFSSCNALWPHVIWHTINVVLTINVWATSAKKSFYQWIFLAISLKIKPPPYSILLFPKFQPSLFSSLYLWLSIMYMFLLVYYCLSSLEFKFYEMKWFHLFC